MKNKNLTIISKNPEPTPKIDHPFPMKPYPQKKFFKPSPPPSTKLPFSENLTPEHEELQSSLLGSLLFLVYINKFWISCFNLLAIYMLILWYWTILTQKPIKIWKRLNTGSQPIKYHEAHSYQMFFFSHSMS